VTLPRSLRTPLVAALAAIACALVPSSAVAASSDGVHPGAILNSDIGQCTDNYRFDGADGTRYIGSAGHCVLPAPDVGGANVGEKTWAPGSGPIARDSNGHRIGEWAYAILQDPKDFSLIRLDPSVPATQQMPTYGGPTGIFDDVSSNTVLLQYFGEGVLVSNIAPARNAVALGTPDPDHVYAQGVVVPGDSGSAIDASDGRAVGVIVTTGAHVGSVGGSGIDAGLMGITRLPPQLARASQVLGIRLTLCTAPLLNGSSSNVVAPTTGLTPAPCAGSTPAHGSGGRGNSSSSGSPSSQAPAAHRNAKAKARKHKSKKHKKYAKARKSHRATRHRV
jgi:hypothetical protein